MPLIVINFPQKARQTYAKAFSFLIFMRKEKINAGAVFVEYQFLFFGLLDTCQRQINIKTSQMERQG